MTDLSAIHTILSNSQAMRYWSTLPHESLDQTKAWLTDMVAASMEEPTDFVIEHDGRVIGKAGFWQMPEIGFVLHPDFWGQGFAQEAVGAVIDFAFASFEIPAIVADVDPRNIASLKLLKKLGFTETHRAARTFLVGEEWCDSIYLARGRGPI